MMSIKAVLLSALLALYSAEGFTAGPLNAGCTLSRRMQQLAAEESSSASAGSGMQSFDDEEDGDAPAASPASATDGPELPELKGDFDWDAKFAQDDDWIVDNVPGKVVLNEIELAAQVTALSQLEDKWRKQAALEDYEDSKQVGFVERAELINGRTAMFFLVTGLLTEYWTGYSFPEQVEEMLRVTGFIGLG